MSQDKQVVQVVTHRLSPEAYIQLERLCPAPALSNNPDSAAYNLGVQFVLAKLREGFVVG
ncbi:hypothetical protein 6937_0036 [Klebsiella phage 6937]|uniref:Uncharacterized protein n=3 Tax=Viruses TaxID=10239 RepID=A0A9E7M808_9CAUD|nr:hypothetical protein 6937_0036 [Klebsiella phage 6937]UZT29440.1 hypothetical protein [Klebsiella phage KYP]